MMNQNDTHVSESIKARNAVIAIAITAALIFLDQVIHLPLWFSVPSAALIALGIRYVYLKRAVETQHEESK